MRLFRYFTSLLFAGLILAGTSVLAQQEPMFKGVVLDSLEKTPLEKCSVSLLHKKGSTKHLANEKGFFTIQPQSDTAEMIFQHIGYTEKKVTIIRSKMKPGTDTILLAPVEKRLDDIVVSTKVPPVVVKGDTTEFNIDSAMFEPFDVVEDLVRRLPGLEIDEEGKMTFRGKPITRILVDGEDLFGGDPTFSMKKLPAGLVAKIQVMDTKTLEQIFDGTPSDGEDKTLNIQLKQGNKVFGSGDATAGTRNQLEGNGNISQFNGPQKLGVMASVNTSNKIGIASRRNGPASSFATGSVNFNNKWGNLRMSSSYSYNNNSNSNNLYRERTQIITADTSFFSRISNRSESNSDGHRLSWGANWFIDSSSTLDMSISYVNSNSTNQNGSSSATLENGSLRNESVNNSTSAGNTQTVKANVFWTKRLNRLGRSISVNARGNFTDQLNTTFNQSTNTYFKGGFPVNGDTLDRKNSNINDNRSYGVNINYAEPISRNLRFSLRGDFDMNRSATNREIYNLDSITKTAVFDSAYSAAIASSSNTQNITASFSYNNKRLNATAGLATVLQQAVRTLQKEDLQQNLTRYAPSLNASYLLTKEKILRAAFSATTIQPSIEQLQPVPDNSNPLYIRLGNPFLRTAFSQTYSLGYSFARNENNVTANIAYSPISNQIVNAVYYDEFRRQTSQFINVNGVYSLRSNASVSKTYRQDKRSKTWSASSAFGLGRQVYFQNNQQYFSRNYSTSVTLSLNKREMVARAARYTVSLTSSYNRNWTPANTKILNTTRLHIAPSIDGGCTLLAFIYATASYKVWYNKLDYHAATRRNDEYSAHHFNTDLRFQVQKKIWVQSAFAYQYNTRVPQGTPKGIVNCNLSATAQVLQGRGQVMFTAVDLFAQSTNLRRTVGENFIEDVQIDNLQNYFTLRFQYVFSKLEKREPRRTVQGIK